MGGLGNCKDPEWNSESDEQDEKFVIPDSQGVSLRSSTPPTIESAIVAKTRYGGATSNLGEAVEKLTGVEAVGMDVCMNIYKTTPGPSTNKVGRPSRAERKRKNARSHKPATISPANPVCHILSTFISKTTVLMNISSGAYCAEESTQRSS